MKRYLLLILFTALLPLASIYAQEMATFIADEGGVTTIVGEYFPSTPSFRETGSQPVVFMGDISNIFVEGAFDFSTENLNLESPQVLAFTEGDIRVEPLRYTIPLPINPGGVLTDVDNDGNADPGVGVYTVNFTFNGIGSPFIDAREYIAFSSITFSQDFETLFEINGGRMIVFAQVDGQGFPSGFGADGEIFTADDPIVTLPEGYTVVDMNSEPFTFDRSATVTVDIVESEGAEFTDFSSLDYVAAFDAMLDMMRNEYAFTELKGVDWSALGAEYRPQFEQALATQSSEAYGQALDGFLQSIPDGHIGSDAINLHAYDYFNADGAGIGVIPIEMDNGRVYVARVIEGSPADQAGIEVGAELLRIDGTPIQDVIAQQTLWFGPYSTDHNRRLAQVELATRFPVGSRVDVRYQNPGERARTRTMRPVEEFDTIFASPFAETRTGFELPVEFDVLPSGYGYVTIYSFNDDNIVSLLLWERAMRQFIDADVPGIIIDMRQNGGGSPDISEVMLGYLFRDETYTGTSAYYFPDTDDFQFDPLYDSTIIPAADVFTGDVVVLIGPDCYSACEFFTYDLTLRGGTEVIGYYPTGGLGGGIKEFAMPEDVIAQFTVGRAVGANNEIHIEGTGVQPTVRVPLTVENFFGSEDALLNRAVASLDR
ncbi:MAG: S41 family peptidase [Chloroflexota bacterium]